MCRSYGDRMHSMIDIQFCNQGLMQMSGPSSKLHGVLSMVAADKNGSNCRVKSKHIPFSELSTVEEDDEGLNVLEDLSDEDSLQLMETKDNEAEMAQLRMADAFAEMRRELEELRDENSKLKASLERSNASRTELFNSNRLLESKLHSVAMQNHGYKEKLNNASSKSIEMERLEAMIEDLKVESWKREQHMRVIQVAMRDAKADLEQERKASMEKIRKLEAQAVKYRKFIKTCSDSNNRCTKQLQPGRRTQSLCQDDEELPVRSEHVMEETIRILREEKSKLEEDLCAYRSTAIKFSDDASVSKHKMLRLNISLPMSILLFVFIVIAMIMYQN